MNQDKNSSPSDPRAAFLTVAETFFEKKPPDYWITMTFERIGVTTDQARDSLRCWLSRWVAAQQSVLGKGRGPSSPISRLLWSAEHQSRGTAHVHALGVRGERIVTPHCQRCFQDTGWSYSSTQYWQLNSSWYTHHGIARFMKFKFNMFGGSVSYLTKYMMKEVGCDWDLWIEGKDF